MNREGQMTDKQFDELLGEMREESIPSDQVEAVKSRVRQRLATLPPSVAILGRN